MKSEVVKMISLLYLIAIITSSPYFSLTSYDFYASVKLVLIQL